MHIRQATIHDLELLVPLFEEYRIFYRQSPDSNKAHFFLKERLEHNESLIYLAFAKASSDKAIGFTQLYPIFSSISMERMYILNDLFIDPNHRNKGVGQALINAVKDLCIKEEQKGIVIQTETTNPAQHLYERLEFTKDPDLHYFWATK